MTRLKGLSWLVLLVALKLCASVTDYVIDLDNLAKCPEVRLEMPKDVNIIELKPSDADSITINASANFTCKASEVQNVCLYVFRDGDQTGRNDYSILLPKSNIEKAKWIETLYISGGEIYGETLNFAVHSLHLLFYYGLTINSLNHTNTTVTSLSVGGLSNSRVELSGFSIESLLIEGSMECFLKAVNVKTLKSEYSASSVTLENCEINRLSYSTTGWFKAYECIFNDVLIKGKDQPIELDLSLMNLDKQFTSSKTLSMKIETEAGSVTLKLPPESSIPYSNILYISSIDGNMSVSDEFFPTMLSSSNLSIFTSMPVPFIPQYYILINLVTVHGSVFVSMSKMSSNFFAELGESSNIEVQTNEISIVNVTNTYQYEISPLTAYYVYNKKVWEQGNYIMLKATHPICTSDFEVADITNWDVLCSNYNSVYKCVSKNYASFESYAIILSNKDFGRGEMKLEADKVFSDTPYTLFDSLNVWINQHSQDRRRVSDNILDTVGSFSHIRANTFILKSNTSDIVALENNNIMNTHLDLPNLYLSYSTAKPFDFVGHIYIAQGHPSYLMDFTIPSALDYNNDTGSDFWIGMDEPETIELVYPNIDSKASGLYNFYPSDKYVFDVANCDQLNITSHLGNSNLLFLMETKDNDIDELIRHRRFKETVVVYNKSIHTNEVVFSNSKHVCKLSLSTPETILVYAKKDGYVHSSMSANANERTLNILMMGLDSSVTFDSTELLSFDKVLINCDNFQSNIFTFPNSMINAARVNINMLMGPINTTIISDDVYLGIDLKTWNGYIDVANDLTCLGDCFSLLYGKDVDDMKSNLVFSSQINSFEGYINGDEGNVTVKDGHMINVFLIGSPTIEHDIFLIVSILGPFGVYALIMLLSYLSFTAKKRAMKKEEKNILPESSNSYEPYHSNDMSSSFQLLGSFTDKPNKW